MERRERYQFFERGDHIGVEPDRFRILHPAVDDPVADRRELEAAALAAQKIREIRDRPRRGRGSPPRPRTSRRAARRPAPRADEPWRRMDALDLTANDGIERPVPLGEEQELDAGRAGVQNENRITHGRWRASPPILARGW